LIGKGWENVTEGPFSCLKDNLLQPKRHQDSSCVNDEIQEWS
jgi:hypothetical protein